MHCVVVDVPQPGIINANCGGEYDPAMIVILSESSSEVEKDQRLRVLGTVAEPVEGTTAFGGTRKFPTVKAEFME